MKKFIITFTTLVLALAIVFTPTKVNAHERYETGVIVGTYYARNADYGVLTVELSDGHQYTCEHPGDDWMRGDIVTVSRDTKGTPSPIDDTIKVNVYLGYEVWYPNHVWVIGDYEYTPMF